MTIFETFKRMLGLRSSRPEITFVVPFFASHALLDDCLNSITQHCSLPHEILLIDDGNTGFDFGSVKKRDNVHLLHMPKNQGPGACRNAGIKAARGSYIQFIDSDDKIIGDPAAYLENLKHASPNNLPDIITGHLADISNPRRPDPKLPRLSSVAESLRLIKIACFTAHLYRADFLRTQGITFPTDTRTAEDTVFLARALPRAASILETNVALYHYSEVEESLSRLPVTLDLFRQRFEVAGLQIAEALAPFPTAQAAKCSVIFKYAVAQVKRHPHVFTGDDAATAFTTLAALADATDLIGTTATDARKTAPVYWDETFDACVELLKTEDQKAFFSFLKDADVRIFKGEKKKAPAKPA